MEPVTPGGKESSDVVLPLRPDQHQTSFAFSAIRRMPEVPPISSSHLISFTQNRGSNWLPHKNYRKKSWRSFGAGIVPKDLGERPQLLVVTGAAAAGKRLKDL